MLPKSIKIINWYVLINFLFANKRSKQKDLKKYWKVGWALLFCTALTVGVTYIPVIGDNIWLGLGIATFKACLVAFIFMHLSNEKSLIYKVLLYTVFFAIGMMFLTLLAMYDPILSPFNR